MQNLKGEPVECELCGKKATILCECEMCQARSAEDENGHREDNELGPGRWLCDDCRL